MGLSKISKFIETGKKILQKCRIKEALNGEEFEFLVDFLEKHLKFDIEENLKCDSDSEDIFGEADKKLGANYDLMDSKTNNNTEEAWEKLLEIPSNSGFTKKSDIPKRKRSFDDIQEPKENKGNKVSDDESEKSANKRTARKSYQNDVSLKETDVVEERKEEKKGRGRKSYQNDVSLKETDVVEEQKEEKKGRGRKSYQNDVSLKETDVVEEQKEEKKGRGRKSAKRIQYADLSDDESVTSSTSKRSKASTPAKSVGSKKKSTPKTEKPKKYKGANKKEDTKIQDNGEKSEDQEINSKDVNQKDTKTQDNGEKSEDQEINSKDVNQKDTKTKDNDENSEDAKVHNEKKSKNEDEANFSDSSEDNEPIKKTCDKLLEDMDNNSVEKYRGTFDDRRDFITEKEPTVSEIKEKYPYLFEKNMVFLEFELITDKPGLFETFKKNVSLYAEQITSTVKSQSMLKVIDSMSTDADEDKKKWFSQASSLMMLPRYMGDNRNGIFIVDFEELPEDHDNRPYIKCEGDIEVCLQENETFRIFVEDIELCTTSNIIEAFFALLASYYIFNAVYPECCENTFYCLEKLYINFSDGSANLKSKIKNLINSLEKSAKKKKKK